MAESHASKRVLMIAFHFPPAAGSSGLQRSLSFCRHLPEHGWEPIVLSAHPRAHLALRNDQLTDIPQSMVVKRAFALDASRHLSIRGSYPSWLAVPDRWVSWCLGAIPAGLNLIRRASPHVIWSTYPLATAHLIGWMLHRFTGLPWLADFRDPMVERDPRTGDLFPRDVKVRGARLWTERRCVERARRLVFCTPGARDICASRYPDVPDERWALVPNGYDEQIFAEAESQSDHAVAPHPGMHLIHSGTLYPGTDRDPGHFLDALALLVESGRLQASNLKITFRASGHEEAHRAAIAARRLENVVLLAPHISYRAAIREMLAADGLLLFQGYTSNPAIPAKLYEYLRARRPIFALVDDAGDTAALLRELGIGIIVPLDDPVRIAEGLQGFTAGIANNQIRVLDRAEIAGFSREARTKELARILDQCLR